MENPEAVANPKESSRIVMDLWASFFSNEKLEPEKLRSEDVMELIRLAEEMKKRDIYPSYRDFKSRLKSREVLVNVAMDLGIDLPSFKHKTTGKLLIGRGLLDAWNKVQVSRFGSKKGTAAHREAVRRDVVTRLAPLRPKKHRPQKTRAGFKDMEIVDE